MANRAGVKHDRAEEVDPVGDGVRAARGNVGVGGGLAHGLELINGAVDGGGQGSAHSLSCQCSALWYCFI
jgi:hypothetical protein